jgi:hypothetical protein
VGSLFDHLRLARQRSLSGRSPGMGASAAREQAKQQQHKDGRAPRRSRSASSTASTSSVRSLLGVSSMDGALVDASFEDEEAVNETLAQVGVGGMWGWSGAG